MGDGSSGRPNRPALARFQAAAAAAAAVGGTLLARPPPAPTNPILANLSREVERVAAFVGAHLEQLWLRLLDSAAGLRAAADTVLPQHEQQEQGDGSGDHGPLSRQLSALRSALDEVGHDVVQASKERVMAKWVHARG